MEEILEPIEPLTWAALAAAALYGMFIVILLVRKIAQKRMSPAAASEFLDQVRERLAEKDFDGAAAVCDTPQYWSKAVPQLVIVGIANRRLGPTKLRQFLAEKFERDVMAELDPALDLTVERIIRAPRGRVWQAWTEPLELERWWLPAPMHCRVERLAVVPGGAFVTSMSETASRSRLISTRASSWSSRASGSCSRTRSTAIGGRRTPHRWR